MRVGGRQRQVGRKIEMQADIFHPKIVVAQCKSFFEYLVDLDGNALRLMLPCKAEQVLHDAMRALRLLVELVGVFGALRTNVRAAGEQLAVAKNRGERIVEFVRYAGNQLA